MIRYLSDLPAGAEVVIVGGGVVGAATAFHAARAGLDPLLVERRQALGSLTTAAAAGGYRLQQDNREEYALVRESAELFLNFAEATGQREYDARVRAQGYLWVTTTEEGAARQRRLVELQRSWGLEDVELLGGDDARRRFPFLAPEVLQARFRGGDGLVDTKALTFGLVAGARARVALRCEVRRIRPRGNGSVRVETSAGPVDADTVVIAAGPFSGVVAQMAGVELPVTTVRRQKVVLPDVPEVPPRAPMTIDDDTGAHWRPAFGGAFLLFTDPATPPSAPAEEVAPEPGFAFRLLDPSSPVAVARVSPFWRDVWEHGARHWMLQAGQYTMTPDRRPLIGPAGVDGVFVNGGYSGHGVMCAPAGARHLVDTLTGKLEPDHNPYRLERPLEARPHLDPL